ncbi:hypothetical protein LCGC14_1136980 [marine sediment metagenome]|uniref:Uncharacterized protein n=1 Tax=marine sediment metagenome TaxID=412755 RepID=A0A0F9M496_9ZZZZ
MTIRLLETIAVVAEFSHRAEDRAALQRHAEMINRGAREGLSERKDRQVVGERYQAVIRASILTGPDPQSAFGPGLNSHTQIP